MVMKCVEGGLRQRKKAQRRLALHEAAVKLFTAQGYEATTVAQIADAAGVSPRTFFSYYPTKEAALFGPFDDLIADLIAGLEARGDDVDSFTFLRRWLGDMLDQIGPNDILSAGLIDELAQEHDFIAGHSLRYLDRIGTALTASVRRDLPADAPPGLAAIAASATLAAIGTNMPVGHDGPLVTEELERASAIDSLDQAIAFVRSGISGALAQV